MASPFLLHVTDKIYVTCDDKCKLRLGGEEGHPFDLTTLPAGKRSAAVGSHGGYKKWVHKIKEGRIQCWRGLAGSFVLCRRYISTVHRVHKYRLQSTNIAILKRLCVLYGEVHSWGGYMSKVVRLERHTEVDHQTGEVIRESTVHSTAFMSEPPYIKMYLDDLTQILDIPSGPRAVLDLMLPKLDYEGYITLSTRYRRQMADTLGIQDQTLRNCIARLVKSGIISNSGRGEYQVNPYLFARGDWKRVCEMRQQFTLRISYSAEQGRHFELETVNQAASH